MKQKKKGHIKYNEIITQDSDQPNHFLTKT